MQDARRLAVDDLVADALELPPDRRAAFLAEACGSAQELRQEVESLIAEAEQQGILDVTLLFAGLKPGELIADRFQIIRFLARGGMGDVYEAFDKELRQRVALKTILPEIASRPDMFARFKLEVRIGQRVTDRHLCRVFDLEYHPSGSQATAHFLFMTMELLTPGGTLQERIAKSGPLKPAEAYRYAAHIAAGLTALHECGYIHRDLKTANVMLVEAHDSQEARAVLTDFGLARSISSHSASAPLFERTGRSGTPDYMAPEQLLGGLLTRATDIYSFGIILHEMITGRRPVDHRADRSLDRRWKTAIDCCLEQNPTKRPQSARAVMQLLGAARPSRTTKLAVSLLVLLFCAVAAWRVAALLFVHRPPAAAMSWYERGVADLRDGTYFNAMSAFERSVTIDKDFTLAHARLAEAASELGFEGKAKSEMLRVPQAGIAALFQDAMEKLRVQAALFMVNKDFANAAKSYRSLFEKASQAEKAGSLIDLGRALESEGKIKEAIAYYRDSAARDPQYASAFLRLGNIFGKQHDLKKAEENLAAAEALYRTEGNAEGVAEVLYQRAVLLNVSDRMAEAKPLLEKAVKDARQSGNHYQEVKALLLLSNVLYTSGESAKGREVAQQAVDIAQRKGMELQAASGLVEIGNAFHFNGDYSSAEPFLRSALEIATTEQLGPVKAKANFVLGSMLLDERRTDEGLKFMQEAAHFYERNGYKRDAVRALVLISRALRQQGEYPKAIQSFEKVRDLSSQLQYEPGIALAEDGLGSTSAMTDDFRGALEHYERSLAASTSMGDKLGQAYTLWNRASTLKTLGRYADARDSVRLASELRVENKDVSAGLHAETAEISLSQGDVSGARTEINKAALLADRDDLDVRAQIDRVSCLINVRDGKPTFGLGLCREAVSITNKSGDETERTDAKMALVDAEIAAKEFETALSSAEELARQFARHNQVEEEWRSLAYCSAASLGLGHKLDAGRYEMRASADLDRLRSMLGEQAYAIYVLRPDVQNIKRRYLRS